MSKIIAVRGKKNIVAVFNKYAQISGKQDTSRPKATTDFIEYVSTMPLNEDTTLRLKNASKQHIDESEIADDSVPSFIKISVDIEEETWGKAMEVFRHAFQLKVNPQMPYFLRVAGTACIRHIEEQDLVSVACILPLEQFQTLSVENKLNEMYKLLLERGGNI